MFFLKDLGHCLTWDTGDENANYTSWKGCQWQYSGEMLLHHAVLGTTSHLPSPETIIFLNCMHVYVLQD